MRQCAVGGWRLTYQKTSDDPAQLAEGRRRSAEIKDTLWRHAEAAAKDAPTPIPATFINAFNELIDTDAERIEVGRNRIPMAVSVLLMIVAACGCVTSAYGADAHGARSKLTSVFLRLLISIMIFLIFDLRAPHQGLVGISQQPMRDLQSTMRGAAAP